MERGAKPGKKVQSLRDWGVRVGGVKASGGVRANCTSPPHPSPFASRRFASPMGEGVDAFDAWPRCRDWIPVASGPLYVVFRPILQRMVFFNSSAWQRHRLPLPLGEGRGEGEDIRLILWDRLLTDARSIDTSHGVTEIGRAHV